MSAERLGLQSPAVTGPQYLRSGKVREIFEIEGTSGRSRPQLLVSLISKSCSIRMQPMTL